MQKIQYINIFKLKPHPNNPRLIKNDSFKNLCKSVKSNRQYFEARPIIVSNRTSQNIIIAGNMRYKASIEIGLKEVPVIIFPNLTEKQEKEIIIKDNVSAGEWDYKSLSKDFNYTDLKSFGFTTLEKLYTNLSINNSTTKYKPKIIIKCEIPPKLWLIQKQPIIKEMEKLSEDYGFTIEIPK